MLTKVLAALAAGAVTAGCPGPAAVGIVQVSVNPVGQPYPIPLSASDPSGVCQVHAIVNGSAIPGPAATADTSQWHQCPDESWTAASGAHVDTRAYVPGAGRLTLKLQATNAADVTTTDTATLNVDNDPVGVTLSGPTDVASATGATHYVTTNVTAGPRAQAPRPPPRTPLPCPHEDPHRLGGAQTQWEARTA
jgi:hypothetical protein